MSTTTPPLLEVAALGVEFQRAEGTARAVADVTFTLGAGQTLGLVGESGSGKSMTALALMGLLPASATRSAQRLRLGDTDLTSLDAEAWAQLRGNRQAMIFQEPMTALNPVLRVGEQIAEALRAHRQLDRTAARARAIELLAQVGMPAPEVRVDDYPHQLSGGMRQRVMIAMALSCDPELLIADEPTTALDVTIAAQILDLLRAAQAARGMAMLLITHDLAVVAETCDTVAVMYAGRLVEYGATAQVLTNPAHPYTAGLLAAMPHGKPPTASASRVRLQEIPGMVPPLTALPAGCAFAPRCPYRSGICDVTRPLLEPLRTAAARVACHAPLRKADA